MVRGAVRYENTSGSDVTVPAESLGGLVENVPFRVLKLQALEDEGLDALEHRREVEVHEGTGHEGPGSDYPQRLSQV